MNANHTSPANPQGSKTHNWSDEQMAIYQWFAEGSGNLTVEALAGTGKTTTIKEAFAYAPEKRMLYAVFNKRNQKEAEVKLTDERVDVKTLHSLGFGFIKSVWRDAKPDDAVEAARIISAGVRDDDRETIGLVSKLVGFAKNTCVNPTDADLARICEEQDINSGGYDTRNLCAFALRVLSQSKVKDAAGRISFNDMVWLPVAMNLVRPRYDLVVIDEAQDMNLPQLLMAREACKPGGRVVVVGDSRQAIYGFRGAVQNGMGMMKATLRAATLKLTTTYRCPKLVVELAAQLVPEYKAAPEAPTGIVGGVTDSGLLAQAKLGDVILSRLNAPLMPLALSFIRRNIAARIEGRDVGRQLIGMVRMLKAKSVPDFLKRVDAWEMKQIARLEGKKFAEKKIEQVGDVAQTLAALAENAASVADIESRISNLFQDSDENSKPAVVLSSVHKAKGLEWGRVFLLSATFRASKGGEEANIYYVALTRSKSELYLVGGSSIAPAEKPAISDSGAVAAASNGSPAPARPSRELPAPAPVIGSRSNDQDDFDIPPGMVRRTVGDVFTHSHSEYVVVRVGSGSAKAVCVTRGVRTFEDSRTGESKTFADRRSSIEVSTTTERGDIVRRIEGDELNDFLSGKTRYGRNKQTQTTEGQEGNGSMKKTTKKTSGSTTMETILAAVKAGKSEKEITAAVKAAHGTPSPNTLYVIGREWRRANKAVAAKKPATKAVKASAKAPANKVAAKVAKTPPASPVKAAVVPATPPPRPAAPAATQEASLF